MIEQLKDQLLAELRKGIEMLELYMQVGPEDSLECARKRYRQAEERLKAKKWTDLTWVDLPVTNLARMVADGNSRAIKGWDDPLLLLLDRVSKIANHLMEEAEKAKRSWKEKDQS
jgi:hypothetical protein